LRVQKSISIYLIQKFNLNSGIQFSKTCSEKPFDKNEKKKLLQMEFHNTSGIPLSGNKN